MIELTTSSRRQQINRITLFGILKKAHFVLLSNVVIITFLKFRWNIGSSKIITYPWPVNIGVGEKSVFSSFFFTMDLRILAFYKISSITAMSSANYSVTYFWATFTFLLWWYCLMQTFSEPVISKNRKDPPTLSSVQSTFWVLLIQLQHMLSSCLDRLWKEEAFWSRTVHAETS